MTMHTQFHRSLCIIILGLVTQSVIAQHNATTNHPSKTSSTGQKVNHDAHAIEHVMKSQFDRPKAPLTVKPVTVEGDFAVAGWLQEGRGGRALLKREHGNWRVDVCGGDGLVLPEALALAGLKPSAAKQLSQSIQAAEAKLPDAQRKQLSSFEGIVKVDSAHGKEQHQKH